MPPTPPAARRLLVLGTSSSKGTGLAHPEDEAYPQLLRRRLADVYGDVELVHRGFYAEARGAGEFFDKQIAAFPADWVVLQTTAFSLTFKTVPFRIERLLGERAGRLSGRVVRKWDGATMAPGGGALALNHTAHWLARHLIGTDTHGRYRPVVDSYLYAIERLARLETTWTAVIGTGQAHSAVARENSAARQSVERFNAELSEAARRHRIPWIDHDTTLPAEPEHDAGFTDGIHRDADWHLRIADELSIALALPERVLIST